MRKKTVFFWGLGIGTAIAALYIKGKSWNNARKKRTEESRKKDLVKKEWDEKAVQLPPIDEEGLREINTREWIH